MEILSLPENEPFITGIEESMAQRKFLVGKF